MEQTGAGTAQTIRFLADVRQAGASAVTALHHIPNGGGP